LKSEIERIWSLGKHVLFDVDVNGGLSLKKYYGDNALAIFVKVPLWRFWNKGSGPEALTVKKAYPGAYLR
jgi:guanylate kinase